jgi:hypothetical protein
MLGTAAKQRRVLNQNHHGVMATVQTCQRRATVVATVQFLQIDASFNSIDVWNAQQK